MKFDKKDELILEELDKNVRATVQEISKKTKIPQTTVFNRIKRLEEENVIGGYYVKINRKGLGRNPLRVFVLLTVDYDILKKEGMKQRDLAKKILEVEDVREVSIVTGESDMIAKIVTEDIQMLNDIVINHIREINGIEKTKIVILLEDFKDY